MQVTKITATTRTDHGKNVCRRLRAEGKLPAVTYGPGAEAQGLVVDPEDVIAILTSQKGQNSVLDLEVDGKSTIAMIKDYQYHPVSRKLLHADFVQVTESTKVEVKVPLHLVGKAKGVSMGGKLRQVLREIPVLCTPAQIPVELEVDVTSLDVEQVLRVQDIKLPEGLVCALNPRGAVVSVVADRRAKKDEGDEKDAKK